MDGCYILELMKNKNRMNYIRRSTDYRGFGFEDSLTNNLINA